MSPHEIHQLPFNLTETLEKLGWEKKTVTQYHERDSDCSWERDCWYNKDNKFLFEESDLSMHMAYELKSIVEELGQISV
jgi:hypothetical protein